MLYVLPPPRAPNPPSPWDSILCAGSNAGNGTVPVVVADRASWGDINTTTRRPPPRAKIQNLKLRLKTSDDSSCIAAADDDETARTNKSLSECYFAGKGTALVLPPHERLRPSRRSSSAGSDIQQHLQSMFYLLRQEETLKMAVKLESVHAGRTRYLVVVSCLGRQNAEESCLLGIDCNERTTVGLVLRVLADTTITLDGDGGFSVSVCGRHHIFKPVSVQAMWSALQTLHKVSSKAREQNYFQGGPTHDWVNYYEQHIESDRSCLNEWHAMDSLESRRPPSPDSVRTKPRERDETEQVIRSTLKEIMMSVDLDEVTSKYIRNRLEEDLDMDLGEFKSFIDQEMLTILGQMDAPTEIFDHVYLGSEWNASNFEELQKNGVGHILNVTREIDNFFPGMFDYLNIRVYDDEKTDLLKHWDNTFKYITKAKKAGSKVLVHCKMGVSRSASVVIAYAMKAYNWDFEMALKHVKEKRNCIKPNTSFIAQLETYQGILDAMKNKEKLQRSKSETNLKSPELVNNKSEKGAPPSSMLMMNRNETNCGGAIDITHTHNARKCSHDEHDRLYSRLLENNNTPLSGHDLRQIGARPKSWSPDIRKDHQFVQHHHPHHLKEQQQATAAPIFLSLENLSKDSSHDCLNVNAHTSPEVRRKSNSCPLENARNVLMFNNGQSYSASPNQIVHICKKQRSSENIIKPLVKHRINELESQCVLGTKLFTNKDKKSLVLNLTTQFENGKSSSPVEQITTDSDEDEDSIKPIISTSPSPSPTPPPPMLTAKLVKKEIWDPGEVEEKASIVNVNVNVNNLSCDSPKIVDSNKDSVVWTSSTVVRQSVPVINNVVVDKCKDKVFSNKTVLPTNTTTTATTTSTTSTRKEGDLFSNQLDKVFDREERKQQRHSIVVPAQQVTELINEESIRECPSRQSSWSSYDSAVVLGYQGETREAPSRHSSWGSGDTRTLPSRNSSWGSYDMKPGHPPHNHHQHAAGEKPTTAELSCVDTTGSSSGMFSYDRDEIPWYPGTVKRTKQKIEGAKDAEKRSESSFGEISKSDKSPSTETLTSDYSTSVMSENDGPVLVEAYNTSLLHYQSSPELCENHNQRIATVAVAGVEQQPPPPPPPSKAISKEIDIISGDFYSNSHLARGGSRLSVSAPETSSINLISSSDCVPLSSSCSASNVSQLEVGKLDFLRNTKSACETSNSCVINSNNSFVKKHKNYLENLHKESEAITKRNTIHVDAQIDNNDNNSSNSSCTSIPGIVKNLKKEFEAKTSTNTAITVSDNNVSPELIDHTQTTTTTTTARKVKGCSLPSSPTNNSYPEENRASVEDISVKELVGKYEEVGITNNRGGHVDISPLLAKPKNRIDFKFFSNKNVRYSCIQMLNDAEVSDKLQPSTIVIPTSNIYQHQQNNTSNIDNIPKRPPVTSAAPLPSVVMATVVKAANKKQKHNKKDAHQCLNIKPRNNNPVYNTM